MNSVSVNRRLALDPQIPDDEREALIDTSPVFVMATLSMHSTEVAPAQTLPLLTHHLATTEDPETPRVARRRRRDGRSLSQP